VLLVLHCRMSTNQQESRDFAVSRHQFSLPGRWVWFEDLFHDKTSGQLACDPPLPAGQIANDFPSTSGRSSQAWLTPCGILLVGSTARVLV
jgi:hypothetical protein